MLLPIISYGHSVLRQECKEVDTGYPDLNAIIDSMWETMYPADGTGLAAPQVNQLLKIFIVDTKESYDRMEPEDREALFDGDEGIKETFINAKIVEYSEEVWVEHEGCLSIPAISEEVERPWGIKIEYYDRDFNKQEKEFRGITARVIQHEFDHTRGKLYIDYVNPIRRKLLGRKLNKITSGQVSPKYKMKFAK